MNQFLSSREAARSLGVSLPTLYAYVSRGLLQSEPAAEGSRARRYRRTEVEALVQERRAKADPQAGARGALNWGKPVLDSAVTSINEGSCFYRGRALEDLADHSFEDVAEWLWRGLEPGSCETHSPGAWRLSPACRDSLTAVRASAPVWREAVDLLQVVLPIAALEDLEAIDLSADGVAQCGARILGLMTATIAHSSLEGRALPSATSIAQLLQRCWSPSRPELAQLLNLALIVSADHELNVSTFTARCVASASSTPYEVVGAGLAALRGRKHGGHSERVEALFQELSAPHRSRNELRASLARRIKRGAEVPGFGHVLYPQGDPRCDLLLGALREAHPDDPICTAILALIDEGTALTGDRPTLDVGLAALSTTYGLPTGSALALFALGRSAGWLAHAIEQYETDQLIRPRARYVGEPPSR
ncbi:MAG: citrate synthase family protein [Acidobacteriota bacterium]